MIARIALGGDELEIALGEHAGKAYIQEGVRECITPDRTHELKANHELCQFQSVGILGLSFSIAVSSDIDGAPGKACHRLNESTEVS